MIIRRAYRRIYYSVIHFFPTYIHSGYSSYPLKKLFIPGNPEKAPGLVCVTGWVKIKVASRDPRCR